MKSKTEIGKTLAPGMLLLVAGLLMQRFLLQGSVLEFLFGIKSESDSIIVSIIHIVSFSLICLSIVFNIRLAIKYRKLQSR